MRLRRLLFNQTLLFGVDPYVPRRVTRSQRRSCRGLPKRECKSVSWSSRRPLVTLAQTQSRLSSLERAGGHKMFQHLSTERADGAKSISLRSPVYWFRNAFHVVRWPAQILLLVAVVCSQPSTGTPLVVVRASRKSVRQYLRLARFKAVSARCP